MGEVGIKVAHGGRFYAFMQLESTYLEFNLLHVTHRFHMTIGLYHHQQIEMNWATTRYHHLLLVCRLSSTYGPNSSVSSLLITSIALAVRSAMLNDGAQGVHLCSHGKMEKLLL